MPDDRLDVLLVGFGAAGAVWSHILERSGRCRVTAVARSAYDEVSRDGITIIHPTDGTVRGWRPFRLVKEPEEAADRPYAYILAAFKCVPDIEATASILAPYIVELDSDGDSNDQSFPTICLLQNGIGIEQPVAEAFPLAHVLTCSQWIGANLFLPSQQKRVSVPTVECAEIRKLVVGLYEGEGNTPSWSTTAGGSSDGDEPPVNFLCEGLLNPDRTPMEPLARARRKKEGQGKAREFSDFLAAGGADVQLSRAMQPERWKKNMWNIGFSSFGALSRLPTSASLDPEVVDMTMPVVRRIITELLYVARSLNYGEDSLPASDVDHVVGITLRNFGPKPGERPHPFKASLLLDLENGRPMELEPIIGAVLDRARSLNIDTPRLDLAYAAIKLQQRIAAKRYAESAGYAANRRRLDEWTKRRPTVGRVGPGMAREAWVREISRQVQGGGKKLRLR